MRIIGNIFFIKNKGSYFDRMFRSFLHYIFYQLYNVTMAKNYKIKILSLFFIFIPSFSFAIPLTCFRLLTLRNPRKEFLAFFLLLLLLTPIDAYANGVDYFQSICFEYEHDAWCD